MKLHFEPGLDYQLQAIEAVCDLFHGQQMCRTEFTVTKSAVGGSFLPGFEGDLQPDSVVNQWLTTAADGKFVECRRTEDRYLESDFDSAVKRSL